MMAEIVYLLCGATSLTCGLLLFRGYRRSGTRLLFWTSLCFAGLTLNNALLFVDVVIVPSIDLSAVRGWIALGALGLLLFGLIWEEPR